jgi:hypothetical protein
MRAPSRRVSAISGLVEKFAQLRVANWVAGLIFEQVLLGDIGNILGFRIFGEEMVEGLVLARPGLDRDRLVPFIGIAELGINVENDAAKREKPVANNLADREFCRSHSVYPANYGYI